MSRETIKLTIEFPEEVEETIELMEHIALTLKNAGYVGELRYEALETLVVFTKKAVILREYYESPYER